MKTYKTGFHALFFYYDIIVFMTYNNVDWLNSLQKSVMVYDNNGARSTMKLKAPHGCIINALNEKMLDDFYAVGQGAGNDKELIIPSSLSKNKHADIAVVNNKNEIVAVIEFKFWMTSIGKNFQNYIEQIIGECVSVRLGDILYYQVVAWPFESPIFDKNKNVTGIDKINDNRIQEFITIMEADESQKFRPNDILISVVNPWIISNNNAALNHNMIYSSCNISDLTPESNNFISSHSSFENFISNVINDIHTK